MKAKSANKVKLAENGLTVGTIISINEIEEREDTVKGKKVFFASQFEYQIAVEGVKKPIIMRVWTGTNINSEKFMDENGKENYNRLTQLLLNLGIIDIKKLAEIANSEAIETDIDMCKLEGMKIEFELEKSIKRRGLSIIKISSIKPVKTTATK